ncbi:putative thiol methyltransferase [Xylona heveae TC161]|uniref:Putative thiol methyltransferase n=1 Tax=Xylona heveae (strain CBS 132557 / TC161) TaxID=1328760 RepID=A0A164ZEM0_XYLHT|nr:putative thiol methyltransferase [Xylona heveae TC161]KZF19006.1 putative thiol methyltransferase [Xylona heveae TC161]
MAPTEEIPNEVRQRLREHFSVPADALNDRWSALWDKGDFLPWDRGLPNPALVDTLVERHDLLGSPLVDDPETGKKRRKRAFVPGCGRGYDVLLLASFGYDAFGLEVSESAVRQCERIARESGDKYPVRDEAAGAGTAKFVLGDFFKTDFERETGSKFDLIYDYTFFCALPPSLRPAWALRHSQLLARPDGNLICVEFPTYKDPSTGGPPFGVTPSIYIGHLSHPGEDLPYSEEGYIADVSARGATKEDLERVAHWRPIRTHEIGKDTDWVSVWRHRW